MAESSSTSSLLKDCQWSDREVVLGFNGMELQHSVGFRVWASKLRRARHAETGAQGAIRVGGVGAITVLYLDYERAIEFAARLRRGLPTTPERLRARRPACLFQQLCSPAKCLRIPYSDSLPTWVDAKGLAQAPLRFFVQRA